VLVIGGMNMAKGKAGADSSVLVTTQLQAKP
jgi:hypothetical protein